MLRPELDTLSISDQRNKSKFPEYLNLTGIGPSVSISLSLNIDKQYNIEPRKSFYNNPYVAKNVIL